MNDTDRNDKPKKDTASWFANLKSTVSDSRGVQALSALLVVQLLVAGGLLWQSGSDGDFNQGTQLVSIDPSAIDQVVVASGEDDATVTLTRSDDNWLMDDEHTTLASADDINELLTNINELKPGLPVASSPASHAQLEVADDEFKRRLSLMADGETVAELLLGTSPGFRKSHARTVGNDSVYAVKLNTFDIPAEAEDWLDRQLLSFSDVSTLRAEDVELALEGDAWGIVEPVAKAQSHEPDQTGLDALLATLADLRVNGFAEPLVADEPIEKPASTSESDASDVEQMPEELAEPLITHELVVVENGTPVTLTINMKGNQATIERSDIKGLFSLPVSTVESLTPEALQQLLVQKSAEAPVEG